MKIKTKLISGAGNTFHIAYLDEKNQAALDVKQMKSLAVIACNENPADGFIFLEHDGNEQYRWDFFNKDGSDAEMCGNATRCVGYYIKNILGSNGMSWHLSTVAGLIEIKFVENEKFKITMTPARTKQSTFGFYCDTGVPHLVLEKNNIDDRDSLRSEAKLLRHHAEFFPKGTNVTFVVLEKETKKARAVSYERGVEDFTSACGTGAMAAALFNLSKRATTQTEVEMPGGTLMMDLSNIEKPTMTGPAVLLGSYEYEIST